MLYFLLDSEEIYLYDRDDNSDFIGYNSLDSSNVRDIISIKSTSYDDGKYLCRGDEMLQKTKCTVKS